MELLKELVLNCDVACDVMGAYENFRSTESVKNTIAALKDEFCCELEDYDDMPMFWLGLAYAMAEKDELNKQVLSKTVSVLKNIASNEGTIRGVPLSETEVEEIAAFLEAHIGRPKRTAGKKNFETDWKPGDIHFMPLQSTKAADMGLLGRYVIIQTVKTTEFDGDIIPVCYLFLTKGTEKPENMENPPEWYQIPAATWLPTYSYRYIIGGRSDINSEAYRSIEYLGNYKLPGIKEIIPKEDIGNPYSSWKGLEATVLRKLDSLLEHQKFDYREWHE